MVTNADLLLSERLSQLLTAVAATGDGTSSLTVRRSSILSAIGKLTSSDAGLWAWGRGSPDRDSTLPLAMIDFGLSESERRELMLMGTSPEVRNSLLSRFIPVLGEESDFTAVRTRTSEDHERQGLVQSQVEIPKCDWGEWILSFRRSSSDSWNAMLFLRKRDVGRYGDIERQLIHTAFLSIPWLHSSNKDSVSTEHLIHLTPRQRTVMFMLLDGIPRKSIATSLGISSDTVGDHIKAIYSHFKVKSATELAALFLRSQ